jgi:hypothetical protein
MAAEVITIQPRQHVTMRREWKSRAHKGTHVAWIVIDKLGVHCCASGKLGLIANFLNSLAREPFDRVTVPGLYEACVYHNDEGSRNGGYFKNRWRVKAVPITQISEVLARLSVEHERTTVIATPGVCSVA